MRSKVINNCKYVYEMLAEKIMEFTEFIKFEIGRKEKYQSNLVEIYRIKEKYLDKDFVNAFLREREKNIGPNRYKIKIVPDPTPADEEVIGEVVLMRKNKVIEKATLITRTNIPDAEKLIYWKF